MLIGGELVSRETAEVRSPFDGATVGHAAVGTAQDLEAALAAAHAAFPAWSRSGGRERHSLLGRLAAGVRARRAELAELLALEIGKPIALAEGEVDRMALTFELAAAAALEGGPEAIALEFDPRGSAYRGAFERLPLGVVLAIAPYNWPYNLAAHKLAPALAAGNCVVLKPSPQARLSSYALARLLNESGCPAGVVAVVDAPTPAVQAAARDPRVRFVSFTGSDAVGWALKASLPPQTRCALEMGGDAAAIVCEDADLDAAAGRIAFGAFAYAGQICISVQHVWVEATVYPAFVERLRAATLAVPVGDPRLRATVCGPLISAAAADRVEAWTREAVEAGAELLAGGGREGAVLAPTLLGGAPPGTRLASEELFGPVATVRPFDRIESALAGIDASRYGLQAGVFTRSPALARRAFRELRVGGVVINDAPLVRFDDAPYGGVKASGFGREGVRHAMLEMTETRSLIERVEP